MLRIFSPGRVLALAFALAAAAAALWIVPADEYVLLPDRATPLAPLVDVEGARPDDGRGGIFYVDIILRRATLLERYFEAARDGGRLVPPEQVIPPGLTEAERRQHGRAQMSRSQQIAAAVALRELGYSVRARPVGALITGVVVNAPATGKVKPADVVVGVDGKAVRGPDDLRRLIGAREPGDRVALTLRREGRTRRIELETVADPHRRERPVIGVIPHRLPAADVRLPLDVEIDIGRVGGPSAGLAFALALVEELGRDVDRGYNVAATGELDLDGVVSPVGGVEQKAIGARRSGVDVLVVPAGENAAAARRHAGDLRVIAVSSFRQALQELATLPVKRRAA